MPLERSLGRMPRSRQTTSRQRREPEELAFRKVLGERIRSLRRERGLNQDEFSDLAGIGRAHVGWIETARVEPRLVTLKRIADALGVSMAVLFQFE